jgi:hypothetical protein
MGGDAFSRRFSLYEIEYAIAPRSMDQPRQREETIFEAARQWPPDDQQPLALLDHPNIAKVPDAGATGTGWPFFVMELVRGVKITDYCDQNHLATAERPCQSTRRRHRLRRQAHAGAEGAPRVIFACLSWIGVLAELSPQQAHG